MELLYYQPVILLIFLLNDSKFVSAKISCSFEENWCDWKNDYQTEFVWKRNAGQTNDRSSGPLNDHTCNNIMGQYIYIAGSDIRTKDSVAVINSSVFSLDAPSNLTFWYNMNGVGIGKLMLSKYEGNKRVDLWKKEGRQGRGWMKGFVILDPGKMILQFSATVRLPFGSDIALDDIQLDLESPHVDKKLCQLTTSTTRSTTFITRSSTLLKSSSPAHTKRPPAAVGCPSINMPVAILPGSCDFEVDLCGNKVSSNMIGYHMFPITWERTQQHQSYGSTRIEGDHSKEHDKKSKGFYMKFLNGFGIGHDDTLASMETPLITTNVICLTFWYNMPSNYSNLNVSVKHDKGQQEVWRREEILKGTYLGWHNVSLVIHEKPPYSIVFQTYNKEHSAYVGIDDILIVGTNVSATRSPLIKSTTTFSYIGSKPEYETTVNRTTAVNQSYESSTEYLPTTIKPVTESFDISSSSGSEGSYYTSFLPRSKLPTTLTVPPISESPNNTATLSSSGLHSDRTKYDTVDSSSTPATTQLSPTYLLESVPTSKTKISNASTIQAQYSTRSTKMSSTHKHGLGGTSTTAATITSGIPEKHNLTEGTKESYTSPAPDMTHKQISSLGVSPYTTITYLPSSTPTVLQTTPLEASARTFSLSSTKSVTKAQPASYLSYVSTVSSLHNITTSSISSIFNNSLTTRKSTFHSIFNSKESKKTEFVITTVKSTKGHKHTTPKTDERKYETQKQNKDDKDSLSSSVIAGIVVGTLCGIFVVGLTFYFLLTKFKRQSKTPGVKAPTTNGHIHYTPDSVQLENGVSKYMNGGVHNNIHRSILANKEKDLKTLNEQKCFSTKL